MDLYLEILSEELWGMLKPQLKGYIQDLRANVEIFLFFGRDEIKKVKTLYADFLHPRLYEEILKIIEDLEDIEDDCQDFDEMDDDRIEMINKILSVEGSYYKLRIKTNGLFFLANREIFGWR